MGSLSTVEFQPKQEPSSADLDRAYEAVRKMRRTAKRETPLAFLAKAYALRGGSP